MSGRRGDSPPFFCYFSWAVDIFGIDFSTWLFSSSDAALAAHLYTKS